MCTNSLLIILSVDRAFINCFCDFTHQDPSNFTKGSLPKHLERPKIIETFKTADLERSLFQPSSFYALVTSGLHSVTLEQPSDPMILLSQGNDRIFIWEEGRFLRLESKTQIQLPAGCLLWVINVNIYSNVRWYFCNATFLSRHD